ncbi:ribosome-associated heat shock protein Hsp15 [Neptunomonas phycophila]|uniref:Heat shock protein 15 n=1 Tax=Neptunomonas phycophila TaxID=1572645 RepID=A0AAW7XG82_9GAMM|nr:ribosome-associated heat shock protein Hsp15 [Neptunomonas phycophila]MDO6453050.1 ribosome-associated heat shock protein Hsp15 [Neptunomonas phycophila]
MSDQEKIRLDKWLWAARFYKTRAIAKQMIEGGKVHYEGQRAKCSKVVEVGATLQVRQGMDERIIVIKVLSGQRRGAPEAQLLYEETADSIERREKRALERKAMGGASLNPGHRPDKRSRRQLLEVKELQRG